MKFSDNVINGFIFFLIGILTLFSGRYVGYMGATIN